MSWFDDVVGNFIEGTLETVLSVASAPIAPFVKQVERYEGVNLPIARARPTAIAAPGPAPEYTNEQGELGHYDQVWSGGELTSTWIPHREVVMDDWYDYDNDADAYSNGGDESWGVNPISVDGAISSALGGVGNLIGGSGGGGLVPAMGVMPLVGAAAAGAVSLGARLAGMFGRSAGTFTINGIKGSMASLWPLVRKYGPSAVAGALGIGAASLAELLMRAPTQPRHRRRGISSRDIRTTKRVVRFTNQMARQIGCVHRPRARYSRARGSGRHFH